MADTSLSTEVLLKLNNTRFKRDLEASIRETANTKFPLNFPNLTPRTVDRIVRDSRAAQATQRSLAGRGIDFGASVRDFRIIDNSLRQATTISQEFGRQLAITSKRFGAFLVASRGIYAITGGFTELAREALVYDRELSKIAQLTNNVVGNVKSVDRTITEASKSYGINALELSGVAKTLAEAGRGVGDINSIIRAVAPATLLPSFDNIGKNIANLEAVLRQFNLSASDTGRVFDLLNTASKSYSVSVDEIFVGLQRAGSAFALFSGAKAGGGDANFKALKEFTALFTSVISSSREAAEVVGTFFRSVTPRLGRPGLQRRLRNSGIELTDEKTGLNLDPFESFRRIAAKFSTLDPKSKEATSILKDVGLGRDSARVAAVLTQFGRAEEALGKKSEGSVITDAEAVQEVTLIRLKKAREELASIVRDFASSDVIVAVLKGVTDGLKVLLGVLEGLKPVLPALVTGFAAISVVNLLAGAPLKFIQNIRPLQRAQGGPIPTLLTPGEKVFGPSDVNKIGSANLSRINNNNGIVPGVGNTDSFFAALEPGSFVLRKAATQKFLRRARGGGVNLGSLSNNRFVSPALANLVDTDLSRYSADFKRAIVQASRDFVKGGQTIQSFNTLVRSSLSGLRDTGDETKALAAIQSNLGKATKAAIAINPGTRAYADNYESLTPAQKTVRDSKGRPTAGNNTINIPDGKITGGLEFGAKTTNALAKIAKVADVPKPTDAPLNLSALVSKNLKTSVANVPIVSGNSLVDLERNAPSAAAVRAVRLAKNDAIIQEVLNQPPGRRNYPAGPQYRRKTRSGTSESEILRLERSAEKKVQEAPDYNRHNDLFNDGKRINRRDRTALANRIKAQQGISDNDFFAQLGIQTSNKGNARFRPQGAGGGPPPPPGGGGPPGNPPRPGFFRSPGFQTGVTGAAIGATILGGILAQQGVERKNAGLQATGNALSVGGGVALSVGLINPLAGVIAGVTAAIFAYGSALKQAKIDLENTKLDVAIKEVFKVNNLEKSATKIGEARQAALNFVAAKNRGKSAEERIPLLRNELDPILSQIKPQINEFTDKRLKAGKTPLEIYNELKKVNPEALQILGDINEQKTIDEKGFTRRSYVDKFGNPLEQDKISKEAQSLIGSSKFNTAEGLRLEQYLREIDENRKQVEATKKINEALGGAQIAMEDLSKVTNFVSGNFARVGSAVESIQDRINSQFDNIGGTYNARAKRLTNNFQDTDGLPTGAIQASINAIGKQFGLSGNENFQKVAEQSRLQSTVNTEFRAKLFQNPSKKIGELFEEELKNGGLFDGFSEELRTTIQERLEAGLEASNDSKINVQNAVAQGKVDGILGSITGKGGSEANSIFSKIVELQQQQLERETENANKVNAAELQIRSSRVDNQGIRDANQDRVDQLSRREFRFGERTGQARDRIGEKLDTLVGPDIVNLGNRGPDPFQNGLSTNRVSPTKIAAEIESRRAKNPADPQINKLISALTLLSKDTSELEAIQAELIQLEKDKEDATSLLDQATSSDFGERFKLQQTIQVASALAKGQFVPQFVVNKVQGGLRQLEKSSPEIRNALDGGQGLGKLTGDQLRNLEIRNQVRGRQDLVGLGNIALNGGPKENQFIQAARDAGERQEKSAEALVGASAKALEAQVVLIKAASIEFNDLIARQFTAIHAGIVDAEDKSVAKLNNAAANLKAAAGAINPNIEIKIQPIQVVLPGAQVLAGIMPSLQKLIEVEITKAINQKNNPGVAGP